MKQRILWIHGIGDHRPGYSAAWQAAFDPYVSLPADAYIEVHWESVFDATRSLASHVALTTREQRKADQLHDELRTILQARAEAIEPQPATRGVDGQIMRWEAVYGAPTTRGLGDWFRRIDESLGDFVKYLASRRVRTAVKEKAKEQLRPLAGTDHLIAIVAHSWGTVVAYDSLIDLYQELPSLRVANLFTLGSPLWMVRRFLDERSGRKPASLDRWINVHAAGDLVGSWLKPAFAVDDDLRVPAFGNVNAHSSYFEDGNVVVLRDILAKEIGVGG